MRRVVVTGIGIVSSIGSNANEVVASLREAKSGVKFAQSYADLGFRSQVEAAPDCDWESLVDRRAARFLAEGTGWAHVAMEQAIADSGLEESEVSNDHTGLIVGSGGRPPGRSSRPPRRPAKRAPSASARSPCPRP
jgi:3-oxoacyl-[acyl-carrier-protein] synthase-1